MSIFQILGIASNNTQNLNELKTVYVSADINHIYPHFETKRNIYQINQKEEKKELIIKCGCNC